MQNAVSCWKMFQVKPFVPKKLMLLYALLRFVKSSVFEIYGGIDLYCKTRIFIFVKFHTNVVDI